MPATDRTRLGWNMAAGRCGRQWWPLSVWRLCPDWSEWPGGEGAVPGARRPDLVESDLSGPRVVWGGGTPGRRSIVSRGPILQALGASLTQAAWRAALAARRSAVLLGERRLGGRANRRCCAGTGGRARPLQEPRR
ncbi:hypothetical protein NDU88_005496 [Pleurodeles waltl]|uniref:Uncharacterized protein n=1 Tax=Pleurodeles waltl TaxID=8319 RepID=A0AAV7UL81_PLEWA|nr:hypothetical protein NDU88_005496 [Pleurodeles waltl]